MKFTLVTFNFFLKNDVYIYLYIFCWRIQSLQSNRGVDLGGQNWNLGTFWLVLLHKEQGGNLKWSSGAAGFGDLVFGSQGFLLSALRSLLSEAHEGLYHLEVHSGGQVVGSPSPGLSDSCTFKVGSKGGAMCLLGLRVCLCYQHVSYKWGRESALPVQEERWVAVMRFLRLEKGKISIECSCIKLCALCTLT